MATALLPYRKNRTKIMAGCVLAALLMTASSNGEVLLASPFTDHMVLQCGMKVPIWGTAEAGEKITIEFYGQGISTVADANGYWRIELNPMKVSVESRKLVVTGKNSSVECDDVLVGDIWLASGQSNMDFSMSKKIKHFAGVTNEEAEIAAANYPMIRMFVGEAQKSYEPTNRVVGEWKVCTPENVAAFSAVGYFFARDLQRRNKIPIGILVESFGASTAEAWIDRPTLAGDPKLKPLLDSFDAKVETFRTSRPAFVAPPRSEDISATNDIRASTNSTTASTNSVARNRRRGGAERDPVQDQHNATVLFNGMIAPIVPFAIRGAIWYQGESIVNADKGGIELYPRVQAALIRDWRKLWGEGDFAFNIVQLAGQQAASNRPEVREAQATVLQLANTGMAVAMDIGEAKNVHPKNKQDVGDRLARIALVKTYGQKLEFSGPTFEAMEIEGDKIRVTFSHADGLVAKDGGLKWFEVAGAEGQFFPADAKIEGKTVVVESAKVAAPVAVRYGWVNFPEGGQLYNSAGLPAVQFRTDAPKFLIE